MNDSMIANAIHDASTDDQVANGLLNCWHPDMTMHAAWLMSDMSEHSMPSPPSSPGHHMEVTPHLDSCDMTRFDAPAHTLTPAEWADGMLEIETWDFECCEIQVSS